MAPWIPRPTTPPDSEDPLARSAVGAVGRCATLVPIIAVTSGFLFYYSSIAIAWTWLVVMIAMQVASTYFGTRVRDAPAFRLPYVVAHALISAGWSIHALLFWQNEGVEIARIAALIDLFITALYGAIGAHKDRRLLLALTGPPLATLAALLLQVLWTKGDPGIATIGTMATLGACATILGNGFALHRSDRELSRLANALRRANDAKTNLLANVSHEIRTPLNGVLGVAQSMILDCKSADQLQKLDVILSSGETLQGLLNDLLDLSKLEAGKFSITPQDDDVRRVIIRVRDLFEPLAREKGLSLSLHVEGEACWWLRFDSLRLHQCVANLVSNAIKFTERGSVRISLRTIDNGPSEPNLAIDVEDTGIGMSADTQGRLFAAFARADGEATRGVGGAGLGLDISRRLARLMGGDLTAASELGVGSTFTLTFRAEAATSTTPLPTSLASLQASMLPEPKIGDGAHPLRVLVVDDHELNRYVVKLFLAGLSVDIAEAADGRQALELLEQREFDIVLLDLHMPVMNGRETIQRIRSSSRPWCSIPVIALTADALDQPGTRFLDMGMDDCLAKPLDRRALIEKIGRSRYRAGIAAER